VKVSNIAELHLYFFTELQLKPEHKPIQHLKNWKSRIVVMFTDQDPEKEDPQLFWRRDAILTIDMEKKVFVPRFVEQNLELQHLLCLCDLTIAKLWLLSECIKLSYLVVWIIG